MKELASSKATFPSEEVSLACILGLTEFGIDIICAPPTGLGNDSYRDSSGLFMGWTVGLGPSLQGLGTGVRVGRVGAGRAECG